MPIESINQNIPIELTAGSQSPAQSDSPRDQAALSQAGLTNKQIVSWVIAERNRQDIARRKKKNLWDECWQLYRGQEDFRDKEEWQSQIALPNSWNSVKQATSAISRLLEASELPWQIEAVNPDDMVNVIRAGQWTDILKALLQNPGFYRNFVEGLESGFIMGLGIWKGWWGLEERMRLSSQRTPDGQMQVMREIIQEGKPFLRAVDPYNFYWLPGSRFNSWVGTIEDIEVPRWQVLEMAKRGLFDQEAVDKIGDKKEISESRKQSDLRFSETPHQRNAGERGLESITLTECYIPLLDKKGNLVEKAAHIVIANDQEVIMRQPNQLWSQAPPYVAFSPLLLPFRTDGVGLIEMTKAIDHGMNRLINLSMDQLLFRLLTPFEIQVDSFENPEDLETGLVPGKQLRRSLAGAGAPAIHPVQTPDISSGTLQIFGALDRAHQQGSLISEIQQALPRFRGAQTATEIDIKGARENDFLSSLARDIDEFALKPIVELMMDLTMQNLDTSNDARVASVLGIGQEYLKGLSQAEMLEMVQGDYVIQVSGITDQVRKAESLEVLVQFMNIVGQNDQWMANVRQDQLLLRILEAFRGFGLRDVENLIQDPATVEAQRQMLRDSELTPEVLRMMPQMIQIAAQLKREGGFDQANNQANTQAVQQIQQQQEAQAIAEARAQELEDAVFEARLATARRIASGEEQGDV